MTVSEAGGERVTDDGVIKFCKLKELNLFNLPNLKSFYQSKSEPSCLFNHQVSFPVLEKLIITNLPVEDIWNKQVIQSPKGSNKVSFSQLKNAMIWQCHNLVNVFPSNMLPRLQNLEKLSVQDCRSLTLLVEDLNPDIQSLTGTCPGMEVTVSEARGEGVTDDGVVKFCKLKELYLGDLPNLKSFYQSKSEPSHLFNHQVSFPVLEKLRIRGLPVKDIWNKQVIQSPKRSNKVSFSQLKNVEIGICDNLVNVFPSNMLPRLQNLETLYVENCCSLTLLVEDLNLDVRSPTGTYLGIEVTVSEAGGEGVTDDGVIKFCKLKILNLSNLPNLKSFYQSKSEPSYLFNYQKFLQDACPNMETLRLRDLKSIEEIQLWDLATTQEYLHNVSLIGCQVSTKVLSYHVKQSYGEISLQYCQGFKYAIDTISVGEGQSVYVERLKLYELPELVSLWNKNLHEIRGFRGLKYINIKKCPQMKSLLTHSMATTLQQLETLIMQYCEMIEEIIIIKENDINIAGEEKATPQIEFSKLEYLILIDLPNLKSFCNDERGSFSFSSLRRVRVENCPKMKTFVSGQICLPPTMMRAEEEDEDVEIINLNAYFEARNEEMEKIIYWTDGSSPKTVNNLYDPDYFHFRETTL